MNTVKQYERDCNDFRRITGYLAPGKDVSPARMISEEDQRIAQEKWDQWKEDRLRAESIVADINCRTFDIYENKSLMAAAPGTSANIWASHYHNDVPVLLAEIRRLRLLTEEQTL